MFLQSLSRLGSIGACLLLAAAGLVAHTASATAPTPPPLQDVLEVPPHFSVTDGQYNTGVRMYWFHSPKASYYLINRGYSTDFSQSSFRAMVRITWFNDKQTITGIHYYYWIQARALGSTSDWEGPVLGERGIAPYFTQQPPNLLANVGTTQSISATAFGDPAISYQWYDGGYKPLQDNAHYSGTRTNTLTFTSIRTTDAGVRYFLRVKNTTGATNSRFVVVKVVQP